MSDLPAGWNEASLGDVCRVVSGATPPTSNPAYWGGEIAWITPNDMSMDRSQTLKRGERALTLAGYGACSARLFRAGSVVISSRAPIGYVTIAGVEMCTNQGCKTAVPPEFIDSRYLYWYLVSAKPDLEARASGTTFKEISSQRFAETALRWPEVTEQRRIVDILEDHLSRLEVGHALVLKSRTRVVAWQDSVYARDIWLPSVPTMPVGELLREPMRNGHSARASRDGVSGVRTLTLTAVTKGVFSNEHTKMTVADPLRVRDLWLLPGDILVQRSNTPELVGTSARYVGSSNWAIFPDLLIRLRANEQIVSSEYLALALSSRGGHEQLKRRARGLAGSMPKIDQGAIAAMRVPVPGRPEQGAIVSRIQDMKQQASRLGGVMDSSQQRTVALRRSLLEAAFAGRLTGRASDLDRVEEMAEEVSS